MSCAASLTFAEARAKERELENLEDRITELWGHLNAATYRFLVLVAEFDRAQGYVRHGLASTAQWLNWQCGIQAGAAREKVRVARALEQLPEIADAFEKGELSYSKVRAMTRVATPANESVLLSVARHGTANHVEKLVRKYRWTQRRDAAQEAQRQHELRSAWCRPRSVRSCARRSKRPNEPCGRPATFPLKRGGRIPQRHGEQTR
jgi:hypothetical protein